MCTRVTKIYCASNQNHPNQQNCPTYLSLVTDYNEKIQGHPSVELFDQILIIVEHIVKSAPSRNKPGWILQKKRIKERVGYLKKLEQEEFPNDREKILRSKINLFDKLQNTYQKGDKHYQYFKNKKITPLQELIQLDVSSQDILPQVIQTNIATLTTYQLTEEMRTWLDEQRNIISNRLSIEKKLKEQHATKDSEQPATYYLTRQLLYRELLRTYPSHDFGKIPQTLKAKIEHKKSTLSALELARLFEELHTNDSDDHTGLVSLANTLARKFPQNKKYTQLASHYSALFELDELAYRQEKTNFTNNEEYQKLTSRIPALKLIMQDQASSYARLCSVEEIIKKQKEQVDTWLHAVECADLWDNAQAQELCIQVPEGISPNTMQQTIMTHIALTKKRETIQPVIACINLFKKKLTKLNTIHPFSKNDHERYAKLADGMKEFIDDYTLSEPTIYTTRALVGHLLKEQKNDLVKRTAILQIGEQASTQVAGFEPPEIFKSAFMGSVFEKYKSIQQE